MSTLIALLLILIISCLYVNRELVCRWVNEKLGSYSVPADAGSRFTPLK